MKELLNEALVGIPPETRRPPLDPFAGASWQAVALTCPAKHPASTHPSIFAEF